MADSNPRAPNGAHGVASDSPSDKPKVAIRRTDQFLVLLCLTGLAITDPLLMIFGENPDLFTFYHVDTFVLITLFACAVAFLPPIVLQLASVIGGYWRSWMGAGMHLLFVAALSVMWLIQWAKWTLDIEQPMIIATIALAGGSLFAWVYHSWKKFASLLRFAAFAPLVSIGYFLSASSVASLVDDISIEITRVENDVNYPPVVFILLDEFPTMGLLDEDGGLDAARFPNLAMLLEQGTWYRHFTVLSDSTRTSVPPILTGRMPRPRLPRMQFFPENLFTLLAPTHHLTVFEVGSRLCDLPECSQGSPGFPVTRPDARLGALLGKTVSTWMDRVDISTRVGVRMDEFEERFAAVEPDTGCGAGSEIGGFIALLNPDCEAQRTSYKPVRMAKFIDTFVDSHQPALYFLHIELPHIPFRFYGDGQRYSVPHRRSPFVSTNDTGGPWLATLTEYRFLLQAQYADRLLGDVFDRLKQLGLWEETLVVITSDHGRSFKLNHSGRFVTSETYDGIAYVPLFVKRPHQTSGSIDDTNMMAHDIVPTIADILDIDIPWPVAGLPAGHDDIAKRGGRKIFFPRVKEGWVSVETEGRKVFSNDAHFPAFSSRWIGAMDDSKDPLSLLNRRLDLDKYLGHSVHEFEARQGGSAIVEDLNRLRRPDDRGGYPGVVVGQLEFQPADEPRVLVAINGRFVTGSPLIEFRDIQNTFIAMLPQDALVDTNEIGIYLVGDEGLLKLTTR